MVDDAGQDLVEVELAADIAGDPLEGLQAMDLLAGLLEEHGPRDEAADERRQRGGRRQVGLGQSVGHLGGEDEQPPGPAIGGDRGHDLGP